MSARIGSLFSGYGGLDLAVQSVYDAEHAWFCEFDDAPSKILAHHWPDVPNHRDVTTVDWSTVEPVDILTGGFPCQDVSVAGRRAGMTDGTRSGLWSHMAHAIDVLRPQLVVIENVGGLFSANATSVMESHPLCLGDGGTGSDTVLLRAIDAVLSTLSELGYDAEWTALRASDVGAAHGRLRVFITAHPAPDASGGGSGRWAALPLASGTRGADVAPVRPDDRPDAPGSVSPPDADPACDGRHEGRTEPARLVRRPHAPERRRPTPPDPGLPAVGEQPRRAPAEEARPGHRHRPLDHRRERAIRDRRSAPPDAAGIGHELPRDPWQRRPGLADHHRPPPDPWSEPRSQRRAPAPGQAPGWWALRLDRRRGARTHPDPFGRGCHGRPRAPRWRPGRRAAPQGHGEGRAP